MKLFLPAILVLSLLACSKSDETAAADNTNSLTCPNNTKATVKKQMTNESGTEYFYYLDVDSNISGSSSVFPDLIPSYLREEGKRISVQFSTSSDIHTYVLCLSGHVYDPSNPDYASMPTIQVCNATAVQ
ncbi:MAG: hypothetical protein ABI761_08720 [Saprospiraceae bacterium]